MKINVRVFLILPWIALFIAIVVAIVLSTAIFKTPIDAYQEYALAVLAVGTLFCLALNFRTLSKAGIWIAHSLPWSYRQAPWKWFLRALVAGVIAGAAYLIGQFPWVPLVLHGAVIPLVFSIALFVIVWSLMGPILIWSSRIAFSRFTAFLLCLPVFALIPVTALFLGHMVLNAYAMSRPDLAMLHSQPQDTPSLPETAPSLPVASDKEADKEITPVAQSDEAKEFEALALSGKACGDAGKKIQNALKHNGPEDVTYWAIRAVKCSDIKSVVALPRLAKIMTDHASPAVRAASIRAMPKFGNENVKLITYLLVRRISEKEPPDVIKATAVVLARLGEDEVKMATNRLKGLLENPQMSSLASKILTENLKRGDLVRDYVSTNLAEDSGSRKQAISMICSLPLEDRKVAEPAIDHIVAAIETGSESDPAIKALDCLGNLGFQAIRQEVIKPQRLERSVAARALSEIEVKNAPQAIETATTCARDQDPRVRGWCSQTLGQIGAKALPEILELLESSDSTLKDSGRNAMNYFDDPLARPELERIRAENSGWMANQRKLQIAKALDKALIKIIHEEQKAE